MISVLASPDLSWVFAAHLFQSINESMQVSVVSVYPQEFLRHAVLVLGCMGSSVPWLHSAAVAGR